MSLVSPVMQNLTMSAAYLSCCVILNTYDTAFGCSNDDEIPVLETNPDSLTPAPITLDPCREH